MLKIITSSALHLTLQLQRSPAQLEATLGTLENQYSFVGNSAIFTSLAVLDANNVCLSHLFFRNSGNQRLVTFFADNFLEQFKMRQYVLELH